MPVYEFNCEECGPFTKLRSLDQSSAPANCPECGAGSSRIFSVIHLRAMRPENRVAWERNERSAHAPHVCGAGCAHDRAMPKKRSNGDPPAMQASTKRNSRPWMLGH
jgi:putative FmdB family regulatory protein